MTRQLQERLNILLSCGKLMAIMVFTPRLPLSSSRKGGELADGMVFQDTSTLLSVCVTLGPVSRQKALIHRALWALRACCQRSWKPLALPLREKILSSRNVAARVHANLLRQLPRQADHD